MSDFEFPEQFYIPDAKIRKFQNLDELEITEKEKKVLSLMIDAYTNLKRCEHQLPPQYRAEKLSIIRGMKYAYDAIQTTKEGFSQSVMWQAILY